MATTEITRCPHITSDVVLVQDEIVARVCLTCFDPLPANWGCKECEWEQQHELGGRNWTFCAVLCDDHRYLEGL